MAVFIVGFGLVVRLFWLFLILWCCGSLFCGSLCSFLGVYDAESTLAYLYVFFGNVDLLVLGVDCFQACDGWLMCLLSR